MAVYSRKPRLAVQAFRGFLRGETPLGELLWLFCVAGQPPTQARHSGEGNAEESDR